MHSNKFSISVLLLLTPYESDQERKMSHSERMVARIMMLKSAHVLLFRIWDLNMAKETLQCEEVEGLEMGDYPGFPGHPIQSEGPHKREAKMPKLGYETTEKVRQRGWKMLPVDSKMEEQAESQRK